MIATERRANRTMPWHYGDRRRWGEMAVQTVQDLRRNNAFEWAAVISFYFLVSLFPLLLLAMITASLFVDPIWATEQATSLLGKFLPRGAVEIEEIVSEAIAARGRAGALALVVLAFTGRRVLGALTKGLNLVSDVSEQDDPLSRRISVETALGAGLVAALLLAFASRPLLELAWDTLRLVPGPDNAVLEAVQVVVRAVLLLIVFTLVYSVVPRGERLWRAAFAGAVVATTLYLAAQAGFILAIDTLWPNLELIYGPLAFAALLLSWGWYIALITLVGASLASHIKVMILEGQGRERASEEHVR
jgi:YihY family inner membrane protein